MKYIRYSLIFVLMLASVAGIQQAHAQVASSPFTRTRIGVLLGHVSIGPLCPVLTIPATCNQTPHYSEYRVTVYAVRADGSRGNLVQTLRVGPAGNYITILPEGDYILDLSPNPWAPAPCSDLICIDGPGSSNVPARIHITGYAITTFNITIDTGIR